MKYFCFIFHPLTLPHSHFSLPPLSLLLINVLSPLFYPTEVSFSHQSSILPSSLPSLFSSPPHLYDVLLPAGCSCSCFSCQICHCLFGLFLLLWLLQQTGGECPLPPPLPLMVLLQCLLWGEGEGSTEIDMYKQKKGSNIYMYNPVIETRQMQATTPEDNSFFPREKEELPRAGLEPAAFCILGRPLYQLSHQGSSAGQAESLKFVQGKWRLSPDKQGYSTSA